MEFKDLPLSFQMTAVSVLSQYLNQVELVSATKKDIDNIARNVRNAFIGMYEDELTSDNQGVSPEFTPHPDGADDTYHEAMVESLRMQIAKLERKLKRLEMNKISAR